MKFNENFKNEKGKELDKNCVTIYNNKEVDNICNTYRKDLEIIANVFISDVNEYNAEIDKYNKESTCIGIINIDNYDEIVQRALPEEKITLLSKIGNII